MVSEWSDSSVSRGIWERRKNINQVIRKSKLNFKQCKESIVLAMLKFLYELRLDATCSCCRSASDSECWINLYRFACNANHFMILTKEKKCIQELIFSCKLMNSLGIKKKNSKSHKNIFPHLKLNVQNAWQEFDSFFHLFTRAITHT